MIHKTSHFVCDGTQTHLPPAPKPCATKCHPISLHLQAFYNYCRSPLNSTENDFFRISVIHPFLPLLYPFRPITYSLTSFPLISPFPRTLTPTLLSPIIISISINTCPWGLPHPCVLPYPVHTTSHGMA
jgi:hypothetical protein